MSDKILKGMVEAMDRAGYQTRQGLRTEYMSHALCWLAENVSDEMIDAATKALYELPGDLLTPDARKHMFRAAILKASESGE